MAMFYALVALCLSGSALAQVPGRGICPPVKVQQNFDSSQFLGRWYEVERYFHNFELIAKCNVIDYTFGDSGVVKVVNSFVSGFDGTAGGVQADIFIPDAQQSAKMLITMPLTTPGDVTNYWILGTDYDSYVVIYCCTNYANNSLNLKYTWILTRDRVPHKSVMAKAYKVIDRNNINRSHFWKVQQTNCPQIPCA